MDHHLDILKNVQNKDQHLDAVLDDPRLAGQPCVLLAVVAAPDPVAEGFASFLAVQLEATTFDIREGRSALR